MYVCFLSGDDLSPPSSLSLPLISRAVSSSSLFSFLGLLNVGRKLCLAKIEQLQDPLPLSAAAAPSPSLSSLSLPSSHTAADIVAMCIVHSSDALQMAALDLLAISGKSTEEPTPVRSTHLRGF